MLSQTTPNSLIYRKTLNRMGWSMLLFIGLLYLFTAISETYGSIESAWLTPFWAHVVTALCGILSAVCYMAPFFLTGFFYYFLSRRSRTERIDFEVRLPREFPLLILAGLAILTAGVYINSLFCDLIGYTLPDSMVIAENYDNPTVVIMYMTVSLAPAFAEEFLFRGVFYSNLRPFGRTQAILISSLLFALMHQNIGQMFYTFVAGIAMALMYEITGSIWCGVFFHMFNNQLSVISEVLYYGNFSESAWPFLAMFDAIQFALGAVSMVLLIFYYKRKAAVGASSRPVGIFGRTDGAVSRYDRPLSASAVCKGVLNPGMITFTVVTTVLMSITWLMLIVINAGGI